MATSIAVGSVSALWRFPVKSMGGERLERADISSAGLLGDRAFALIDTATGKVVSAKSVNVFPGIPTAGPPSWNRRRWVALFPCVGAYAVAEAGGTLRVGDRVALVTPDS